MAVNPGPYQPVDLKSFRHPIAEELNELTIGITDLLVASSTTPQVLPAAVINFMTNQPGSDEPSTLKSINSYI